MNARLQRAKQIMELENHASQIIGENKYKVRSQTNPDKYYIISKN